MELTLRAGRYSGSGGQNRPRSAINPTRFKGPSRPLQVWTQRGFTPPQFSRVSAFHAAAARNR